MLLRLKVLFDPLTYIKRLEDGINLSTEVAQLVPYRICRFLVFEGQHNSDAFLESFVYILACAKIFTFELQNDRRTVKMSLFSNVNFYSEICFKKLIDLN